MTASINTRELSFSAINALKDTAMIEHIIEVLEREAGHIEAQLDFPNEGQDENWERNAVLALGHHRAQAGCARRRLAQLLGRDASAASPRDVAEAIAAEARATERLAKAKNREVNAMERDTAIRLREVKLKEYQAEKAADSKTAALKAARNLSSDALWRTAAHDLLDAETAQRITDLMLSRLEARVQAFLTEEEVAA